MTTFENYDTVQYNKICFIVQKKKEKKNILIKKKILKKGKQMCTNKFIFEFHRHSAHSVCASCTPSLNTCVNTCLRPTLSCCSRRYWQHCWQHLALLLLFWLSLVCYMIILLKLCYFFYLILLGILLLY